MKYSKSIILLAGVLSFALGAAGALVDAPSAAGAVKGWLRLDQSPLGAKLGDQVADVETFKDSSGYPLYHVVNLKPSGFVVVSAEDQVEPIIAFVNEGKFDPSEKNPLGALISRDLPKRVASVRKSINSSAGLRSQGKWQMLQKNATGGVRPKGLDTGGISDVRVAPFIATSWDQQNAPNGNACYNFFTPPFEAGNPANAVCGCVATALAQLMYCHQYPSTGIGASYSTVYFDGYPMTRQLRGGDGFGGPYDWSNMPTNPISPTINECKAIGALTSDAGVAVHMQYTLTNSGSYLSDAKTALVTTFQYGNAIIAAASTINVGVDLTNMINPNLDAHLPVIFGIDNSVGGHAIVCDGYGYSSETLYHHLNMGWGGAYNAWYQLPIIDLPIDPYYNFNACLFNVFTNGGGEIISGRVLDMNTNPVVGASVTAYSSKGGVFSATTDAKGIYALVGLPSESTCNITVANTGYFPATSNLITKLSADYATNCGNVWGVNFTLVSAMGPPVFTVQPTNQVAIIDSNAAFTAYASGQLPLYYQWQYSTNGGSIWINANDNGTNSGSQTSTLTISPVTLALNGALFQCVVTNSLGSATSAPPAILSATGFPPVFIIQATNRTVLMGSNVTFNTLATGTPPLFYQWQYSTNGGLIWLNVINDTTNSGAQTPILTISPAALSMNGEWFQCVVTNSLGSATSASPVMLTVNGFAPAFVIQPQNQTVVDGTNAAFSAFAAGTPPISYQWQYQPSGSLTWVNVNDDGTNWDSQSPTLWIIPVDLSMNGKPLHCIATNPWGSATSAPVSLGVIINNSTAIALSTLAGQALTSGSIDGLNTNALFNNPHGIAVDKQTNIYVTDIYSHVIRKLTPSGSDWVVGTIAGLTNNSGSANGTNTNARFNAPYGIAVDASSNVFVADTYNQTIRKLTPSGSNWVVTTIAGLAGITGTNDGNNARFKFPMGITLDNNGNLYVADEGNHSIRKLVFNGVFWDVSTIAGGSFGSNDGVNGNAQFGNPYGITVDTAGTVFVADQYNNTIRQLSLSGTNWVVTTIAGKSFYSGSADGIGSVALFKNPTGIAAATDGTLYVADYGNHIVRRLAPAGADWSVFTVAGVAGNFGSVDGVGSSVRLNGPFGIAVDNSANVYVSDSINKTIRGAGLPFTPIPAIVHLAKAGINNSMVVSWNALVAHDYLLQYKTNLHEAVWKNLTTITASNWTGTATIPEGTDPQRFYRVIPAP